MSLDDDRQLLRRLRDLPPPPTPQGLEARLLAGIPARRARAAPAGAPHARRRRIAIGAALAAGVVLAVTVPLVHRTDGRRGSRVVPRDVQPAFVQQASTTPNHKETQPCDILPPLSRSL